MAYSFGLQYYCVGLLNLTGDALSFAGPLLLHACKVGFHCINGSW